MSITKNSDDYDEEYMKIKFNSDDRLPLNKTIEIATITKACVHYFIKKKFFFPTNDSPSKTMKNVCYFI